MLPRMKACKCLETNQKRNGTRTTPLINILKMVKLKTYVLLASPIFCRKVGEEKEMRPENLYHEERDGAAWSL